MSAIEISPASEGAARLTTALMSVTDWLSVPAVATADLESGEAGFHLIGSKTYSRGRNFFLRAGYAHLESILDDLVQ